MDNCASLARIAEAGTSNSCFCGYARKYPGPGFQAGPKICKVSCEVIDVVPIQILPLFPPTPGFGSPNMQTCDGADWDLFLMKHFFQWKMLKHWNQNCSQNWFGFQDLPHSRHFWKKRKVQAHPIVMVQNGSYIFWIQTIFCFEILIHLVLKMLKRKCFKMTWLKTFVWPELTGFFLFACIQKMFTFCLIGKIKFSKYWFSGGIRN